MSKRANGEGCVYKDRVRGSWIGEYTIITSSGLRKRKRCRAKTQREALKKIKEIKRSAPWTRRSRCRAWAVETGPPARGPRC